MGERLANPVQRLVVLLRVAPNAWLKQTRGAGAAVPDAKGE